MKLNRKLALAFALVLIGFSVLLLLFENLFISRYYIYKTENQLRETYSEITEYFNSDNFSDTNKLTKINELSNGTNITIYLFDKNGFREGAVLLPGFTRIRTLDDLGLVNRDGDLIKNYDSAISKDGISVSFEEEKDSETRNIGYIGKLTRNNETKGFVFLFTSYTLIRENTRIFNSLIMYITIILLVVSAIVSSIISNQMTKPLKKIEETTRKIANLDFSSEKLDILNKDEIGSLSNSINKMSYELEKSINELKDANLKLEEDIKLKERVNKLKEEFISDVSHELKTPISIISGYSEALKLEGLSTEDINSYADIIIDESKRMNKMVRDLLKFTQIESGFISLDKEDFSILELVNEVIKPYELRIKEKKVDLEVNVDDVFVNGDFDMMETVFNNLFSNAMNYVDMKRKIKVYSKEIDDKIRLYVYNSGDRIDEEHKKRIFDSFYRIDKSRSRKYGGSGLGLSIVKSIMDTYKNDFGIENNDDGVIFYFDLNKGRKEEVA